MSELNLGLLVALIVVLLLVFFYPAVRRLKLTKPASQREENVRLYRRRVAELEAQDVPESQRAALQLELDRELLASDLEAVGYEAVSGKRLRYSGALVAILLAVILILLLYQRWGAGSEVRATELLELSTRGALATEEYTELERVLEQATLRQPENLEWVFLHGRLLEAERRYGEAALVYAGLLDRLPEDRTQDRAAIMTSLVQAQFFSNGRRADEGMYATLKQAIELVPDERKSLGLAGIMAYELGYFRESIEHWRRVWEQLPADSMEARTIANGITRAASELQAQGETVDVRFLIPPRIAVEVSLSDEAKASVPDTAFVFVIARQPEGPPLPLAVQRLLVSHLPYTVVLDNTTAMAEGMNLGSVDEVTVTARVSLTGQPMAQPGDWQGSVSGVRTRGAEAVSVMIDQEIIDQAIKP